MSVFAPPSIKAEPVKEKKEVPIRGLPKPGPDHVPEMSVVPPQTSALDIGKEDGIFRYRPTYHPENPEDVTLSDLVHVISALGLILDPSLFRRLPERVKHQFLILDRNSKVYRYGGQEWDMLQESEK